jgi:hypothetical protein
MFFYTWRTVVYVVMCTVLSSLLLRKGKTCLKNESTFLNFYTLQYYIRQVASSSVCTGEDERKVTSAFPYHPSLGRGISCCWTSRRPSIIVVCIDIRHVFAHYSPRLILHIIRQDSFCTLFAKGKFWTNWRFDFNER